MCVNSNNVLTEFLNTGIYNRSRPFYATISPSMDILVSSNLERLLYDLSGQDSARVAGWMSELATSGKYKVNEETFNQLQNIFMRDFAEMMQQKQPLRKFTILKIIFVTRILRWLSTYIINM